MYLRRGWRIPRNSQGEVALDDVRPDIDSTAEDLANGYTEVEALRRLRDRTRAARHNAMKWHTWQVERGIVPPEAGARLPAATEAHPPYKGSAPAEAKGPGGKGVPPARSRTPGQAKGSGGKGRGSGSQLAGKGGKKGAHPGRGEYSRYAGYSGAASLGTVRSILGQRPGGPSQGSTSQGNPLCGRRHRRSRQPCTCPRVCPRLLERSRPGGAGRGTKTGRSFQCVYGRLPLWVTARDTRTSPVPGSGESSQPDGGVLGTRGSSPPPRVRSSDGDERSH